MTYIFVNTLPGLKNISLNVNPDTSISQLISLIYNKLPQSISKSTYVSMQNGSLLTSKENYSKSISQTFADDPDYLLLRLNTCLCGGKGGFGSMLKSQGKKKRKKGVRREEDDDNFRTLDGRTMKSIRQAKELLGHMEKLPKLERERIEKKRAKLQAIIDNANSKSESSSSKFNDIEYLETSENLITEVRNAVNGAMEVEEGSSSAGSSSSSSASSAETDDTTISDSKGKEKALVSDPTKTPTKVPKAANFFDDEDDDE